MGLNWKVLQPACKSGAWLVCTDSCTQLCEEQGWLLSAPLPGIVLSKVWQGWLGSLNMCPEAATAWRGWEEERGTGGKAEQWVGCHLLTWPRSLQTCNVIILSHGVTVDSHGLWRISCIHLSLWHLEQLVLHISAQPPCACHYLNLHSMLLSAAFTMLVEACQQRKKSSGFLSILQVFTINLSVLDRILPVKFQVSDSNMKIWI